MDVVFFVKGENGQVYRLSKRGDNMLAADLGATGPLGPPALRLLSVFVDAGSNWSAV